MYVGMSIGIYGGSMSIISHIENSLKKYFFRKNISYSITYLNKFSNNNNNNNNSYDLVFANMNCIMREVKSDVNMFTKLSSHVIAIADCVDEFLFAFKIKAFSALKLNFIDNDFEVVLEEVMKDIKKNDRVVVNDGINKKIVGINDILYLEALGDNSIIVTNQGDYISTKPLKYWEELLKESFFRIHKSYLVSLTMIDSMDLKFVYLKNTDNKKLPIAVRRRKELLNVIEGGLM